METFKKICLTILCIPVTLILYVLFVVICVIMGVIALPFALVYLLVDMFYEFIRDIWKGEYKYAK